MTSFLLDAVTGRVEEYLHEGMAVSGDGSDSSRADGKTPERVRVDDVLLNIPDGALLRRASLPVDLVRHLPTGPGTKLGSNVLGIGCLQPVHDEKPCLENCLPKVRVLGEELRRQEQWQVVCGIVCKNSSEGERAMVLKS